jgi:dTDP-4-dehydrorhamnose 3,5-epimerase
MIFTPTDVAGAYVIDLEPIVDERGFFARAWCREEFQRQGLLADFAQANIAYSQRRGTLRGLHYVGPPVIEAKLVRCTRGAAFVVVADIRRSSPSHGRWVGTELTADNHRLLYVPPGCAQGYQTLLDQTEMLYQMSAAFVRGTTRGIRYDDPAFQIRWPLAIASISSADESWPPYCAGLESGSLPASSPIAALVSSARTDP